jgi:hypothetical protein
VPTSERRTNAPVQSRRLTPAGTAVVGVLALLLFGMVLVFVLTRTGGVPDRTLIPGTTPGPTPPSATAASQPSVPVAS